MIVDDNKFRLVHGIEAPLIQRMCDYLLGAVRVWCRDRRGEWFSAKDLLGGNNFNWQSTPMMPLYEYYSKYGDDYYAIKQAGRAAGHILKRVLVEDRMRTYQKRKAYTNMYRWVAEVSTDD